jgi:SAM-dependent methyltransferase
LEQFATTAARLQIEVIDLLTLLDASATRPIHDEIDRVGRIVVETEKDHADPFYYNQYHKHRLPYFQRRIAGLGVSGRRALDAGCGVGQWSYALRSHFSEVHGVEINRSAIAHLSRLTAALRWPRGPVFSRGSIEALPYGDATFDFIFCYGVVFVTAVRRTVSEFRRTLTDTGQVYVCLNGDGWYEYLCDDRFADQPPESLISFARPLWNAMVARSGGEAAFNAWCRTQLATEPDSFWRDTPALRDRFAGLSSSVAIANVSIVNSYSDRVIDLLGRLTRVHVSALFANEGGSVATRIGRMLGRWVSTNSAETTADRFPLVGIGSTNRPFAPAEFKQLAASCGLKMIAHGPDAGLSHDGSVKPIYAAAFNGHDSVWECMLANG